MPRRKEAPAEIGRRGRPSHRIDETRRDDHEMEHYRSGRLGPLRDILVVLTLFLLALACSRTSSAGPELPADATQFIAGDAVVCLEFQRLAGLIDRISDSRFQNYLKLLPPYQRLLKNPKIGELRAVIAMIATHLDTTWDQAARELIGGGVVAAVEADPGQGPRLYVLITPRHTDLLERASQVLLRLARQDAKEKGKPDPVKTSQRAGVIIYALGSENGPCYAIVAGKLVVSNSVKNLERLIDRRPVGPPDTTGRAAANRAAFASLAEQSEWKSLKNKQSPDSLAWGFAHLDRLRQLDPNRFTQKDRPDNGVIFLFGSWYQAFKLAPAVAASIRFSDSELGATIELPVPSAGRAAPLKGYIPESGTGAAPLLRPPGTIASLSLWRDMETVWESRCRTVSTRNGSGVRAARHSSRPVFRCASSAPTYLASSILTGGWWSPSKTTPPSNLNPT